MKRRSVKLLALLATASISMSIFAGCSKTKDTGAQQVKEDEQVLNIAVFEGAYGSEYWKEVIKRFEADNPGVKINMESNPKIGDMIRPKIASGNSPDFIYLSSGDQSGLATALIKDKALTDLSDVFDGESPDGDGKLKDNILDGFLDNTLTAPYGDGKVYLAPLYYNVTGMWYNKSLFKEKGYEIPNTWDDFYALGEKAKGDGIALFTYQGNVPGYNEAMMYSMVASAGGEEALKDVLNYEEGAWKSEAGQSALNAFNTLAKKGYILEGTPGINHTQAQQQFLDGKALFIPCGNWLEGEMEKTIPEGFQFGFMAPPVFKEGQDRYATTMIEQMYIPKDAKNVELAKKFLAYQYKEENVKLNSEKSGAVVPVKNGLELAKPYLNQSNYECFQVYDNGAKPITLSFRTTGATEVNIKDQIFNPINSIVNGEITVEEWTKQLEDANAKLREVAE